MPIRRSDLQWQTTTTDGVPTGTVIPDAKLNNVFPDLTGAQQRDGAKNTRLIALVNTHPSLALTGVKVYISKLDTGGAHFEIALDPAGVRNLGQPLKGDTDPATYSVPTTESGGLSVAQLGPGQAVGIWVRQRGAGSSGTNRAPERNTLTATGTSPA